MLTLLCLLLLLLSAPAWAGVVCDGVDDQVVLTNESLYDCTNATCTLSFWLNTANAAAPRHFVSKAGPGTGWQVSHQTTLRVVLRDAAGNSSAVRDGTAVDNDAAWHHFMIVFTTSTTVLANNDITIYTDGLLAQGSLTRPGNVHAPNNNNVEFCHNTVNANFTAMTIDDVHLYSGDLGAAVAERLYKSRARFLPIQATPLLYLPMNSCVAGASVNDTIFPSRTSNGTTADPTGGTCGYNPQLIHARGVE